MRIRTNQHCPKVEVVALLVFQVGIALGDGQRVVSVAYGHQASMPGAVCAYL